MSKIRAYYGQRVNWRTVYPAGSHLRKVSPAQMNYHATEQGLLAIVEALMKREEQLLGQNSKRRVPGGKRLGTVSATSL